MTTTRRSLDFRSFDEALAEIERLRLGRYRRSGRWGLVQIVRHCSIVLKGSLDGFGFWAPWPIQPLARRFFLKKILRNRRFPVGVKTHSSMDVTDPGSEETPAEVDAAISELRGLIRRLETEDRPMAWSPLFGQMPRTTWLDLHLVHLAHHLSFLVPGDG
jgi:hypothetical protein